MVREDGDTWPRGVLIGQVTVAEVRPARADDGPAAGYSSDWDPDEYAPEARDYAWVLVDPVRRARPLPPVTGRLRLYDVAVAAVAVRRRAE